MIPVEKKREFLLREDQLKVIIYEFFNTIGASETFRLQTRECLLSADSGPSEHRD
jgi:hypothetical protein